MVAVRADAGNRHAVDANVMRALGAEGILVNISRGSVVDEAALIALLQSGQLGGAGLDVFEHEPMVPDALKALPQVVLTPHVGGCNAAGAHGHGKARAGEHYRVFCRQCGADADP